MERDAGIEPASLAWKARAQPLDQPRIKCISAMRVCSKPRKDADSMVEGEEIHPVVLGAIVNLGKVLKVLKDMKAAYVPSS